MFLARIELHKATYDDYETLHRAMESSGFSRSVKGDDGNRYQLPTAEYYYDGTSTCEQVRTTAKTAANQTGLQSGVIVADASRLCWQGLAKL